MQKVGVIYTATGERCRAEAVRSARSLKKSNPLLPVTIFSDSPLNDPCFDSNRLLTDCRFSYIDKIAPLLSSPYERTLFLDSDTHVCGDISELFLLLDRFQLAAAHDTWRLGEQAGECPSSFFEFNTGVLLYRNTPGVQRFFQAWLDSYNAQLQAGLSCNDQSSFRSVLYLSDIAIYVLGSEYNFTTWCPGFVGARGRVKILHGKNPNLQQIAEWLNTSLEARSFVPLLSDLNAKRFGILTARGQRVLRLLSSLWRLLGRE